MLKNAKSLPSLEATFRWLRLFPAWFILFIMLLVATFGVGRLSFKLTLRVSLPSEQRRRAVIGRPGRRWCSRWWRTAPCLLLSLFVLHASPQPLLLSSPDWDQDPDQGPGLYVLSDLQGGRQVHLQSPRASVTSPSRAGKTGFLRNNRTPFSSIWFWTFQFY